MTRPLPCHPLALAFRVLFSGAEASENIGNLLAEAHEGLGRSAIIVRACRPRLWDAKAPEAILPGATPPARLLVHPSSPLTLPPYPRPPPSLPPPRRHRSETGAGEGAVGGGQVVV